MAHTITFDLRKGTGVPEAFLMGSVEIEPTAMHTSGTALVFPAPIAVPITSGTASVDLDPSPAGDDPAWAYRIVVRETKTRRAWSEIVRVPDVAGPTEYTTLERLSTSPAAPPLTTWGEIVAEANAAKTAAEDSATAAAASAGLVGAPAGAAVLAAVSEGGAARGELIAAFAGRSQRKAVTLSKLPGWADGQYGYNAAPYSQNTLTVGDVQYAAWWNGSGMPMISKRTLPNGAWDTPFDLGTVAGNPLAAPVVQDGHNTLSIGVDTAGYIHIVGNLHGEGIRYVKSTAPGSITGWAAATMTASETQVTYPEFVHLPNGTLLFFYRARFSGNGDMRATRYNPGTGTWTDLGKLMDGDVSDESPYWNKLAVDDNGDVHVFYCWRASGQADTNADFSYVKLTNLTGTVQARKSTGASITLPITHPTGEVIIPGTGLGLLNQQGADVDSEGHPHAVQFLNNARGTQLQHIWHDGSAWQSVPATNFAKTINLAVSILSPELSRAQVVCGRRGETYIIYRANFDGKRGTVRAIDVTHGEPTSDFVLAKLDLWHWEPSFDKKAARERGELNMLLVPGVVNGPAAFDVRLAADSFNAQYAGVLTVDLDQMNTLSAGSVKVPALRPVISHHGPTAGIDITATGGAASIPFGNVLIPENEGAQYFGRIMVRGKGLAADVTLEAYLREFREQPSGAQRSAGKLSIPGTANDHRQSPWIPLQLHGTGPNQRGFLEIQALKVGGTANAQIGVASIELSVLDYE